MKKVKLMLLSLSLLAVVGGALAFKASRLTPFCTAAVPGLPRTCPDVECPNAIINQTTTTNVNFAFICTSNMPLGGGCAGVTCVASTRLKADK
jgi:hypothetical protein